MWRASGGPDAQLGPRLGRIVRCTFVGCGRLFGVYTGAVRSLNQASLVDSDPAASELPSALLAVIQELSGLHDLESVTRTVARAVRTLTGADGASFVLREGALVYYVDEDAIAPLWKGRRFPAEACVSGWAILNRQHAVIPDIYVDPRIPADAYRPTFVKSLAVVPIREHDPLGAIGAYWARTHEATPHEVALLQALANATAVAIANVELYGTLVRATLEAEEAREVAEAARAEAEAASRVREEFLAMLGHELRNPLAPIVMALRLLRARGLGGEREHGIIERQVKHMVRMVDDLLDVSRVRQGRIALQREAVDVAAVVDRAIEAVSPMLVARGQHLERRVAAGLRVSGDSDRLVQVLANLLTNAAKYTPEGGHIRISGEREGEEVALRVADDGIGISPALLPQIFDLFVQARQSSDRAGGGLGLGLALVRSIVGLHGGSVTAHSAGCGRGSEFVVRLPPLPGTSAEGPAPEVALSASARRRKLLIVDDNADAAEMLAEFLTALGWMVQVAGDGPGALALLERFEPEVALLDIGLPLMDGYELATRMQAMLGARTPRMIAVTGYGQDSDRARSRARGFDLHLVKPVDPTALLAVLGDD